MEKTTFSDINIYDIGNTIAISGVVLTGKNTNYLCFLPDQYNNSYKNKLLDMDLEEWKRFVQQTDLLETEILAQAPDNKLTKTILRKTTRLIDSRVSWEVYKRDSYRCRYCYSEGIPMTVDHLVLWEDGGPSIEENLVTACRKCNKLRGNIGYREWLKSKDYNRFGNLPDGIHDLNCVIEKTLGNIPRKTHIKSR